MSLINEALKKAQKLREAEAARTGPVQPPTAKPPAPPPTPPIAPSAPAGDDSDPVPEPLRASRRKRTGLNPKLVLAGLGSAAVVLIIVLIATMGSDNEEPQTVATSTPPPVRRAEPEPPDPTPKPAAIAASGGDAPTDRPITNPPQSTPVKVTPADTTVVTNQIGQPAEPASVVATRDDVAKDPTEAAPPLALDPATTGPATPAVSTTAGQTQPAPSSLPQDTVAVALPAIGPATAGTVRIVSDEPTVAVAAPVSGADQPDPRVQGFLERVRVTGIRASPTDPKVLMNDRVYRLNDIVDRDLQIRVVSIAPRQLRFTDPRGYTYTKSF